MLTAKQRDEALEMYWSNFPLQVIADHLNTDIEILVDEIADFLGVPA